jgi:choline dehydrogenase
MMRSSQRQKGWDYIIIGAGSAGCVLAHELTNGRGNETVLVLEAGGSDRSPLIRLPAGSLRVNEMCDWGYWSQPDPSRNGRAEQWERGRVLGGCSSVNSTVFVRGALRDFDRWASQCGGGISPGWSAREVLPLFRELESSDQIGPFRGQGGQLHVRTVKRRHLITEAFVKSAQACGHPFNEDYNGEVQEGVSFAQLSQRHGLRCSSADAFLRPLLGKSKNLSLVLNALVQRIEFINRRAVAVSFKKGGKVFRETAREIILCAGAINSPKLLMLSGIGDAEELKRNCIGVVADLPGVGGNLKDHPLIKLVYRTRGPTHNLTEGFLQKLGIAATYLISREGPISNLFEGIAFLRTSPSEPSPDLQVHFTPMGFLTTPEGKITLAPYPSVSVLVNKNYPISSGRIRLASNDPNAPPIIECKLLEEEADVDTLVRGMATVRGIMQTEPIVSLLEEECVPGPEVSSIVALKEYVRNHTQITFHFCGTCRMGTGPDAVVGPDLRVRGTENLWVADASIMPDLISGNTNAVCMMIGKRLGKQFVARRRV